MINLVKIKLDCFNPTSKYMLRANNGNTRKRCEIFSKVAIKIPEQVNSIVLVSLL